MGSNIVIEKTSFSSQIKNQFLTRQITTLISDNHWNITCGKYKKLKMQQVFKYMRASQVDSLQLQENQHSQNILLDFCHINFTHMKILILGVKLGYGAKPIGCFVKYFYGNFIKDNNKIMSISALKRWNYFNLKYISLKTNKIAQLDGFQKAKFCDNYNPLCSLQLLMDEQNDISKDLVLINDISCIVKMNASNLSRLGISNKKRILQYKTQQILKDKWVNLMVQNNPAV